MNRYTLHKNHTLPSKRIIIDTNSCILYCSIYITYYKWVKFTESKHGFSRDREKEGTGSHDFNRYRGFSFGVPNVLSLNRGGDYKTLDTFGSISNTM